MKQDNQRQTALYAYLAGIIDGEGTIRVNRTTHRHYVGQDYQYDAAISVGMTNRNVIEILSKYLGAKMYIERVPENRKQIYRWVVSGNRIIPKILKKILPYLIVKKKQAELVLMFCEGYKRGIDKVRKCRKCGEQKKIQAYGLCGKCDMFERRHHTLDQFKNNFRQSKFLPIQELQRREELYLKVKKLNAVGSSRND